MQKWSLLASLRELIINQKSDYLAHQAILVQIKDKSVMGTLEKDIEVQVFKSN